ncbi:hypothetical protein L7F22_063886 [Adiantum nelumboides]|nr:hypothetical protein [Adiantum nelumboides]
MGRKVGNKWEYVQKIKPLPKGKFACKCNFCGHCWDGGPACIRAHMIGLKGYGVDRCGKAPEIVRDTCRRLLAKKQMSDMPTEGDAHVDVETSSPSKEPASKKPKVSKGALIKAWESEACQDASVALQRFFFAEDIPHWKVRSPYFLDMVKAIARAGPSFKPLSNHCLRTKELHAEVNCVEKDLLEVREKWKRYGCSIVCDGWSNNRRRPIINIMVT